MAYYGNTYNDVSSHHSFIFYILVSNNGVNTHSQSYASAGIFISVMKFG